MFIPLRFVALGSAAAHLAKAGDRVIICAYCEMTPEEAKAHKPVILLLDESNKIK